MNLSIESSKIQAQHSSDTENLTVADAVWVGTADLQYRAGDDRVFTTDDLVEHIRGLALTKGQDKSIWQHVNQHCVANRKPQPNRACILFATGRGNRRLFREGDLTDLGRVGAPTHPEWAKLPAQHQHLRLWYETVWNGTAGRKVRDPLLSLIGVGGDIWKDIHADEYVAQLRAEWGGER
jgi:hypothetical protein